MLNVLASCWSVMARLWSNTVLQIYFKIHLSILKLKQGNLPIYKSKSSGTVKFTLIHLCSGNKLNLDSIKSHSSIHSTSRDGYMVGAEYGLGCTKYAAARNVSQIITRFFQTFQWEYQIHTLCFQRIKKNYDFLVYNKTCVSLIRSINTLFRQITPWGCMTSFKYHMH